MTTASARRVFGGIVGVSTSLVLATGAVAAGPSWQPPIDVRVTSRFVFPTDSAFSGNAVVVAWSESTGTTDRVGFKVSDDGGSTFGPLHLIADATDGAAAICGSEANVVWAQHSSPGTWTIERASVPVAGGPLIFQQVAASSDELREPDVACANGRIFVSWREHVVDETSRMFVASAKLSDSVFASPTTLGLTDTFYPTGLALAGSDDHAYATFVRLDGRLRIKRWTIGAGPGYSLSTGPASIIGPGTDKRPTYEPDIDADGDSVAVTWGKCSSTLARVSTDAGASWGAIHTIVEFGCGGADAGSGPNAISVHGSRLALTYNISGIPNANTDYLVRSNDGFNTLNRSKLGEHEDHIVGFVVVGGNVKLADTFRNTHGHRIKFRRQT